MLKEISVSTHSRTEFIDITSEVAKVVKENKISSGLCYLYAPHTTAGLTINENADPSVVRDILYQVNKHIPFDDNYHHTEGNAAAHIKSTLIGCSIFVLVENGNLLLGTWQGIYFCEFDGPRRRKVWVKVIAG